MSEPIEFEATRDRAYAARLMAQSAPEWRAWVRGLAGVLLLAAALGLVAGGWGVVAALLVLGVAASLVYYTSGRPTVRRLPEHWFAPRRYTITDESVSVSQPMGSATYRWDIFRQARETPDAVVLEIPPGILLDLPVAAMTAGQLDRVRAILRARDLVRPRSGTMAG